MDSDDDDSSSESSSVARPRSHVDDDIPREVQPWNMDDSDLNLKVFLRVFLAVYQKHLKNGDLGKAMGTLQRIAAKVGGGKSDMPFDELAWQDLPTEFHADLPGHEQFQKALQFAAVEPVKCIERAMEQIQWRQHDLARSKRMLARDRGHRSDAYHRAEQAFNDVLKEIQEKTGVDWMEVGDGWGDRPEMRAALGDREEINTWAESLDLLSGEKTWRWFDFKERGNSTRRWPRVEKRAPLFLEQNLQIRKKCHAYKELTASTRYRLKTNLVNFLDVIYHRWKLAATMHQEDADIKRLSMDAIHLNLKDEMTKRHHHQTEQCHQETKRTEILRHEDTGLFEKRYWHLMEQFEDLHSKYEKKCWVERGMREDISDLETARRQDSGTIRRQRQQLERMRNELHNRTARHEARERNRTREIQNLETTIQNQRGATRRLEIANRQLTTSIFLLVRDVSNRRW